MQHNILKSLKEHGYTEIEQRSNGRYLTEGIMTTSIDSIKTRIMSDEILCQDFDGCIIFYKDFLKQSSADDRQSLGIASESTNNASCNKSVMFSTEGRYYESNEWYTLSKNKKYKFLKLRSNINGGNKSTNS